MDDYYTVNSPVSKRASNIPLNTKTATIASKTEHHGIAAIIKAEPTTDVKSKTVLLNLRKRNPLRNVPPRYPIASDVKIADILSNVVFAII